MRFGLGLPAALGRRACVIKRSTAPAPRRRQARRRGGVWHPGRCRPSCRPRRMRSTSTGRRSNSQPTSSGMACVTRRLGGGLGSARPPWWRIWHWAASTNPVGMACATPASMGSWHELGPTSRILRLFNTQVARVPTMAAVPGVSVLGCHGDAAAAAVCTGVRPSALVGRRRAVRSNACCRTRAGALICRLCTGKFAAVARCSAQGVEHTKRARVAAAPRQLRRGAWLRARRTHAALWRGRIGGGPICATGEGPAAGASAAARPTPAATT